MDDQFVIVNEYKGVYHTANLHRKPWPDHK